MIKFFANFLKGWRRKEDGSVAIEFSLLVWPFVMLSLAIIELSLMYTAESVLEGAVTSAARQIRTGQLQQSGAADMEAAFRTEICKYTPALIDCSKIIIEAQVMNSFSDYDTMAASFDQNGTFQPAGFSAGGSSSRVLVRAAYYYPAMTPILLPLFQSPGNTRLFMSTIVLQVEPYDFASEAGGA